MIWVLGAIAAARAACPATVADIRDAAGRSEVAFAAAASADFAASVAEMRTDLGCLTDALGPTDVAAIHRIEALSAFLGGERATVVSHFAAAQRIEPGWQLPTSLALGDHPLRHDFESAGSAPAPAERSVPPPADGWLRVEGMRTTDVPTGAPFVLQRFDGHGAVAWSGLVPSGGALPSWPVPVVVAPAPAPLPVPVPEVPRERRGLVRVPLLVVGGLAAAGSGLSLWQARQEQERFWDPVTPGDAIDTHADRANRWGLASAVSGGVAVGAVGAAVLVGRW